jgi:hypothetical protein
MQRRGAVGAQGVDVDLLGDQRPHGGAVALHHRVSQACIACCSRSAGQGSDEQSGQQRANDRRPYRH